MKMHLAILRGTLASVFLFIASASISAAPRNTTPPPGTQIFLRVSWGSDTSASDWMPIFGFDHEIVSPRDAASGLPTGKRQHKPVSVTKPMDQATPKFIGTYVAGQEIPSVEILLVRSDQNGNPVPYLTFKLDRAQITSHESHGNTGQALEPPLEEVAFVYHTITWTYEPTGASASDSWSVD